MMTVGALTWKFRLVNSAFCRVIRVLSADLLWFTWRLLLVATAEVLLRVWFLALVVVRLRATY
ncbi:hypothetical protein AB9K21_04710 [Anaplasma phagocytophilum]|uniref:hypothetical protein n=1 Tax=Anaplasma phagocytophilum TaxID=948 RepID=UPI00124A4B98